VAHAVHTYDALGRLTKVTYSNGVVITYVYDAAGNRTSVVVTGAPG
jgi:YD repeat-containing protein